jgi:hypothetical protein
MQSAECDRMLVFSCDLLDRVARLFQAFFIAGLL